MAASEKDEELLGFFSIIGTSFLIGSKQNNLASEQCRKMFRFEQKIPDNVCRNRTTASGVEGPFAVC